jgi:tetratricopeptide (TPR) repeat protein
VALERSRFATALTVIAVVLLAAIAPVRAGAADDDRAQARLLAAEAERWVGAGDLTAALHALERAEVAAPRWAELKVNLAGLRSRAGDQEGAMRTARAALALDPALDGARYNLGLAQFRSGDFAGAAETLARDRAPTTPASVLVALGLSEAALDRPHEAALSLDLAVATGVRDPAVLYALVRARAGDGQAEAAASAADLLRRSAPDSAAAQMLEGDALDQAREWSRAEEAYRRALAADPRFPGAQFAVGLMRYKRRDYDGAGEAFARELAANSGHAPAARYAGLLELDRGRPEAAVPLLERAAGLSPRHAETWRDLGRAALGADRPQRAAEALRRSLALDPTDPSAHFLLGRALHALGRPAEGDAEMKAAAQLNVELRARLEEEVSGAPPD